MWKSDVRQAKTQAQTCKSQQKQRLEKKSRVDLQRITTFWFRSHARDSKAHNVIMATRWNDLVNSTKQRDTIQSQPQAHKSKGI